MAGRPGNERRVTRHRRLLRRLRDAVDVRADGNHRLAGTPRRHPRGWDTGHAFLDGEPVVAQDLHEVFRRLDLLKPELAEAEDLIDHLLRELRPAVDVGDGFALEPLEPRGGHRGPLLRTGG